MVQLDSRAFFRERGVAHFTYMSDQEGAIRTMILEAIEVIKGRGEYAGAVPENSPVGESASNGRAERAIQRLEGQLRTFPGKLEKRLGEQPNLLKHKYPLKISWCAN